MLVQSGTFIYLLCANAGVFGSLADRITEGTPMGGPTDDSVLCMVDGVSYEVFTGYVLAAFVVYGGAYSDGVLGPQGGGDCSSYGPGIAVFCAEQNSTAGGGLHQIKLNFRRGMLFCAWNSFRTSSTIYDYVNNWAALCNEKEAEMF
jgi:hypothetical protein